MKNVFMMIMHQEKAEFILLLIIVKHHVFRQVILVYT